MIVCMRTVVFGVLRMMSVLVIARRTANAVLLLCEIISHPSKCVLICGCSYKGKGHYIMSRV